VHFSVLKKHITDSLSYLSIGAAGVEAEAVLLLLVVVELVFWVLLANDICEESMVRGTLPMRYQIPMLFSSLVQNNNKMTTRVS